LNIEKKLNELTASTAFYPEMRPDGQAVRATKRPKNAS